MTDLDKLFQVISHALAPAFLLGAVAGFVGILPRPARGGELERRRRRRKPGSAIVVAGGVL